MTTEPPNLEYRSFVVRLWRAEDAPPAAPWHGEIESIQSGQQWHFAALPATFEQFQLVLGAEAPPLPDPASASSA